MKRNGKYKDKLGTIRWYKNGLLHRDNDLPAVIWSDGTQEWFIHGKRHRDNNLPALVKNENHMEWWLNGNCHRENGPATIHVYGSAQTVFHQYFILGNQLTKEEFEDYQIKKTFSDSLKQNLHIKSIQKMIKI